jgi:FtsP/CotA-like multicopper oxidase with cupredoxin domain
MDQQSNRRDFLALGGLAAAGMLAGGKAAAQHQHHGPGNDFSRHRPGPSGSVGSGSDRGKLVPGVRAAGLAPVPVETPDLPKLYWEMKDGAKEFHLYCRHMRREFLPDMWFDVWGFNNSMPGPTIEAFEGDRVRLVVHNELPESTVLHWHGLEVPNRMDGVHGLTQDPIPPGQTYTYEFTLHQNGTFFYHSHGPMQEGMGMAGLFIIHPRVAYEPTVDHDFGLLIQEWAILPQNTVPNTMSMEFNFFTINGRSGPYATPLVVRLGSRVRIRFVNMSPIDHHPMHMHGHTFWITGTEAGRIPESAWIPSNNVLVAVAQARDIEFIANNPGDWMIHCHMFHHMMNHMTVMVGPMAGHTVRGMPAGNSIGSGMGMITRGPALTPENGPSMGRGMGEQTGNERTLRTGPQHGHGPSNGGSEAPGGVRPLDPRYLVPGYPQDMMDMHGMYSEAQLRRINKPETRGMRRGWFAGVEALMTVLRVLPSDLYDQVVSGEGEIPPGASVPGGTPGEMPGHHQH